MFSTFVRHARLRLEAPLPGAGAQIEMAPVYRKDPRMASIEGKQCKEAAVLALLHPVNGRPALLLIRRPSHLTHHAGQIAFPGGRREGEETLEDTALREAHEEIGVQPEQVSLLGALTPLFVPPSGFCVHPFLGYVDSLPPLTLDPGEVDEAFSVSIEALADPDLRSVRPRRVGGVDYQVPCFEVENRTIWGATAMMLAELIAVTR